jgi:hypothetical protein
MDHPHYACSGAKWFGQNNRVCVSRAESQFQPGRNGAGIFPFYDDVLSLTSPAPNTTMSKWRLPLAFHPESGPRLSNTAPQEWSTDGKQILSSRGLSSLD